MGPADVFPLLRQLADGRFHGGAALAAALGVSRSTVCQRLDALAGLGIDCHRVRGRGYRLPHPLDLLEGQTLTAALAPAGLRVELVDHTASTSSDLLARASLVDSGLVRITEWQTAGRGRQGRRWLAPPAQGLTFSVAWRFAGGVQGLAGLSLAVAVAVARACQESGIAGVRVKWPNDLLLHDPVQGDRKLGGVLVDVQGDALGPSVAVIGIGLNVHAAPDGAGQPAAALADGLLVRPSRQAILIRVLRGLASALQTFEMHGFAPFRDDWLALHAWQGRAVEVSGAAGAQLCGVTAGIDADGALLLETATGCVRVLSGDLSLRRADGPTRADEV